MLFGRLSGIKPHIFWQSLLLAVLVPLASIASTSVPALKTPVTIKIGQQQYRAAIAKTPSEQERGLMYQTHLPQRTGMLFPITPNRRVAFWMKNTLIPLDMLFIQNNRLVQIVHDSQPCKADPCSIYVSDAPVDAVLELPGGTAQQDHLEPGTPVQVMWRKQ